MHPGRLGRERLLQRLESGDAVCHPFKENQFQPKRVLMKDGTTLYRNRLLPDSDLLEAFMNASRIYIRWMITQSCSHPRNKLQGSKCGCMIELGESDVECLAMQQLAFFTQEKRCREARIFEWIKSAWVEKRTRKECSDGSSRIREKETHRRWKGRKFLLHNKVSTNRRGKTKSTPHFVCVNALLQFYCIPYARFKVYVEAVSSGRIAAPAHLLTGKKVIKQ